MPKRKYCPIHQFYHTKPQCVFCLADMVEDPVRAELTQSAFLALERERLDEEAFEMEELDMM